MKTLNAAILEFGAQSAVFAQVRREAGEWRIEELLAEGGGRATAGPATEENDWRAVCARLAGRTRYRGPVTLVVPSHLLLAKHVAVPPVRGARREKAIRFAAGQAIPYPLADVVWDSVEAEAGPRPANVLVVAAKREAVEQSCAAAEEAGFRVESALPAPLATLTAHQVVGGRDQGPELLLTLGERSHELVLLASGGFRLRIFAAARIGDCGLARQLAGEIERSLRHFQSDGGIQFTRPVFVWLGGAAATRELAAELSASLGIPVERRMIAPAGPESADEMADVIRWRMFGASAIAFNRDWPRAELLPLPRREKQLWRRRAPWLATAGVLALAALLPPVAHHHMAAEAQREQLNRLEAELAPHRARDAHRRAQLSRLAELGREIAVIEGINDQRDRWLGFLGDLQERLGAVEDVWFDRLESMAGAAADTDTPLRLAVSGRMLDRTDPIEGASTGAYGRVKELVAQLAKSPYIAEVRGERFDHSQPGILRFDLQLVANPERPL